MVLPQPRLEVVDHQRCRYQDAADYKYCIQQLALEEMPNELELKASTLFSGDPAGDAMWQPSREEAEMSFSGGDPSVGDWYFGCGDLHLFRVNEVLDLGSYVMVGGAYAWRVEPFSRPRVRKDVRRGDRVLQCESPDGKQYLMLIGNSSKVVWGTRVL